MTELKTKPNDLSVKTFLDSIADHQVRSDCYKLVELMQKITGQEAKMWGNTIVGFGSYHYKYASGREGDWMITGFAPRKQNLTVYIMEGFDRHKVELARLGPYTTGKSCLYIKKLEDINLSILKEIIKNSVESMKGQYKTK